MPYYQQVAGGEEIRFGNTDLVIRDGFTTVTSQIVAPTSRSGSIGGPNSALKGASGSSAAVGGTGAMNFSHFYFGNDLTQRGKVDSLIPGETKFTPSRLEVWTFAQQP